MEEKKVLLLVNKDFEYAGYRAGVEYQMTAGKTPNVTLVKRDTRTGPNKYDPSCIYDITQGQHKFNVREYCISYLFNEGENTSNSEIKFGHLEKLISTEKPDFVISVSTSESTYESQENFESINGCVIMGHRFYARDCREFESSKPSKLPVDADWMSSDNFLNENFFNSLNANNGVLSQGMEVVPSKAFKYPRILPDDKNVSLGVINIVDYYLYKKADKRTYEDFIESKLEGIPVGLETTHGVIRMAVDKVFQDSAVKIPVLFVSPIVDRYLCFDEDVDDRWGMQNKVASYNAGVAVINMLEHIFAQSNSFLTND
ncbi:MAG: hypothetical protein J5504_01295 [Butyrivibrio sp.]|nr:hypothetical protein [Butyrivibrio sp.]